MKEKRFASCLIILLIVFILNFNLISAAEETTSTTTSAPVEKEFIDIGTLLGMREGFVTGSGISTRSLDDCNQRISFAEDDASLKLGDSSFNNIGPLYEAVDGGKPVRQASYIDIDCSGNILKADFKTNDKGGIYDLNGIGIICEPNSRVKYDFEKGKLEMENAEIKSLENLVISGKAPNGVDITGENIKFKNKDDGEYSHTLNKGVITAWSDESFSIPPTKEFGGTSIDNINIVTEDEERIRILFEGNGYVPESSFIRFNGDELNIVTGTKDSNQIEIDFNKGNKYFNIDDEDYVSIKQTSNSKIIIQNRNKEGLEPLVVGVSYQGRRAVDPLINYHAKNPFYTIENGENVIKYYEVDGKSELFLDKYNPDLKGLGSTPMQIVSVYKGESSYTDEKKIIIDNNNKLSVVRNDITPRVKNNWADHRLLEYATGVKINIEGGVSQEVITSTLSTIKETFDYLTPEMKEAVNEIKIVEKNPIASASANMISRIVSSEADPTEETLVHEISHIRHAELKNLNLFGSLFNKEWKETMENIPQEMGYKNLPGSFEHRFNIPKKLPGSGEYYGYVADYGTANIDEDVATFTQFVITDPEFFKGRLLQDSKLTQYSEVYRGKLDLLYKYKFITREQYQNALKIGMSQ